MATVGTKAAMDAGLHLCSEFAVDGLYQSREHRVDVGLGRGPRTGQPGFAVIG